MSNSARRKIVKMHTEIDKLRAENAAQLAELHGIAVALGTNEGHSSITHIERLKAELKSIDGALDDPRANLTLTTAEIIWELKAELAEAKKDAELCISFDTFRTLILDPKVSIKSGGKCIKKALLEAMKGK